LTQSQRVTSAQTRTDGQTLLSKLRQSIINSAQQDMRTPCKEEHREMWRRCTASYIRRNCSASPEQT